VAQDVEAALYTPGAALSAERSCAALVVAAQQQPEDAARLADPSAPVLPTHESKALPAQRVLLQQREAPEAELQGAPVALSLRAMPRLQAAQKEQPVSQQPAALWQDERAVPEQPARLWEPAGLQAAGAQPVLLREAQWTASPRLAAPQGAAVAQPQLLSSA